MIIESSVYPVNLIPSFYYVHLGMVVGIVIEDKDQIPETFSEFDDFILNKFGIEVHSNKLCNEPGGAIKLRDHLFDVLSAHLRMEKKDHPYHKNTKPLTNFDNAMSIIDC